MSFSSRAGAAKPDILLVEDNADDETLALRALRRVDSDLLIDVVRDGAEALDYLKSRGGAAELPQVMLLDLKLPKVSGLDVLRHLRSEIHTNTLPVVVLTSSDEERDKLEAYARGANSYVRKPVDYGTYTSTVEDVCRYWLRLNEPPPLQASGPDEQP